jgi:ribosome-associated protein
MIHIAEGVTLNDQDIVERFVRAEGPGRRNVQHDATAVELRVDLGRLNLPLEVVDRLIALPGHHVTNDGILVVVARGDESQARNREIAREQLLLLLSRAAAVPAARRKTRPRRSVRNARRTAKQQHRALKRARRPPERDRD